MGEHLYTYINPETVLLFRNSFPIPSGGVIKRGSMGTSWAFAAMHRIEQGTSKDATTPS